MNGRAERTTDESDFPSQQPTPATWHPSLPAVAVGLTLAVVARSILAAWTIQQGFVEYNADGFTRIIRGFEWLQSPRWEVDVWPPLQFWLYGALLAIWDNVYLAPRVLNYGLSILTILLLFSIGTRLLDRRAGLIAAFIGAIFPYEVWLSLSGMSEPLSHVLIIFAVFGFISWWIDEQPWWIIPAGMALAAATAVRYEGWFYVAAFLPILIASTWYLKRQWLYPAIACLLAVSFMAVWMQQNHQISGDPLAFVRATEEIRVMEDPENVEAGFRDRVTFFPKRAIEVAPLLLPLGIGALGYLLYRRPWRWAGFAAIVGLQAVGLIVVTAPFASLGPGAERFLLSNILLLSVPLGALVSIGAAHLGARGTVAGGVALLVVALSFAPNWASAPTDYPAEDTRELASYIRGIGQSVGESGEVANLATVLLPEPPSERFNEGYALRVLSNEPARVETTWHPSRLYEAVQNGDTHIWVMDSQIDAEQPPALGQNEFGRYIAGDPPAPAVASSERARVAPGDAVTVSGNEFAPEEPVSTWWTGPTGDVYSGPDFNADASGAFQAEGIPLPADATPGEWTLTMAGQESLRQAFVSVEVTQ